MSKSNEIQVPVGADDGLSEAAVEQNDKQVGLNAGKVGGGRWRGCRAALVQVEAGH